MNIHDIYGRLNRGFRQRRIEELRRLFPQIDEPSYSILDVGGTCGWWSLVKPGSRAITIVNLDGRHAASVRAAGMSFLEVDGRSLPFNDRQFDLVFSNSVIEHVGALDDQRRFAREIERVGQAIYVQTPNRWFPIEPHLITLFIHWAPTPVQRKLIRWLSVWGWITKPTPGDIDAFLQTTRLLTRDEMHQFFPQSTIIRETWLGLTKSLIAVRGHR